MRNCTWSLGVVFHLLLVHQVSKWQGRSETECVYVYLYRGGAMCIKIHLYTGPYIYKACAQTLKLYTYMQLDLQV